MDDLRQRQLARRGRLADPLQAREQNDLRPGLWHGEVRALPSHQLLQLVVDHLHELLVRGDSPGDADAQGGGLDAGDELADDGEGDLRRERFFCEDDDDDKG